MNNEPVAWMDYLEHSDVYDLNVSGRGIPLYTHPADESFDRNASHMAGEYVSYTAKTLTDEEIKKIANDYWWSEEVAEEHIGFARAILRKAQEK